MLINTVGLNVDLSGKITTEDILKDIIETDQDSEAKAEMVLGVNYYNTKNDILKRDFRKYFVNGAEYTDSNKSNEFIVNNLHKALVDQKKGYIASKDIQFSTDDKALEEELDSLLGERFQDIMQEYIQGASNKGRETLHCYIDSDGDFGYCVIPEEQIIYITDTTYQKTVEQVVRYYNMDFVQDGETVTILRVEMWDKEKVTKYQETTDKMGNKQLEFIHPNTMGITVNPQYHWYDYNTNFTDKSQMLEFDGTLKTGVVPHGWGKVPFVQLQNNNEERNDLMPIKKYIDALDIVSSGFINDLKDVQLAIWVLRGYEGESLAEFMQNLQQFKAISLSTDAGSSAEPKTMDIPKEARMALMEWLEKKIYEVGQGVNPSALTGGSITNVYIEATYSNLDSKCNTMITKMRSSLQEFMYFAVKYINDRDNTTYDYKQVKFTFNKDLLFNIKEKIEGLIMTKGTMSLYTLLKNLPYVDNVEEELKRIAKETPVENMGFQ